MQCSVSPLNSLKRSAQRLLLCVGQLFFGQQFFRQQFFRQQFLRQPFF
jgi:hypothetical protein